MEKIAVSKDCGVMKYVGSMNMPTWKKREIDVSLEKKKKYEWGIYKNKNRKEIFVKINKSVFLVQMREKISIMDIKLGFQYLLGHNGTEELNNTLCLLDCPLRDTPECTMKLLLKKSS